jgi:hypothetical protein
MKFLTFATVVGTASAFLAPAPMHTRTQGRVSTLSFLYSCLYVVLVIGKCIVEMLAYSLWNGWSSRKRKEQGGGGWKGCSAVDVRQATDRSVSFFCF